MLREQNDLDFFETETLVSLWLGNQALVAPHFDFPENIACVVSGKRKFTLFAPDQISNLYPGSVDFTPSGQPISMVNTRHPERDKFPDFSIAESNAICAELNAGDAIYIPSMWWHQVESFSPYSALVNYWWRVTPSDTNIAWRYCASCCCRRRCNMTKITTTTTATIIYY